MLDYAILSISDRCADNKLNTEAVLNGYTQHSIDCFDGIANNAFEELSRLGIELRWQSYDFDERSIPPLGTEIGVWLSNIRAWDYMLKNKLKYLIVLEDDAIVCDNFKEIVESAISEAGGFDFISLYYSNAEGFKAVDANIDKVFLEKTDSQYAGFLGVVYSLMGAKKIMTLIKRAGIWYTIDCLLFEWSRSKTLKGYRLKKQYEVIKKSFIRSEVDPTGSRNSLDVSDGNAL